MLQGQQNTQPVYLGVGEGAALPAPSGPGLNEDLVVNPDGSQATYTNLSGVSETATSQTSKASIYQPLQAKTAQQRAEYEDVSLASKGKDGENKAEVNYTPLTSATQHKPVYHALGKRTIPL